MKKLDKLTLRKLQNEATLIEKKELAQMFGGGDPIDWYTASDSVKISTILNGYANGDCRLDDLFDNVGGTAYTSNPYGTEVTLNGQSYNVVVIVGNFDDNYADYGYVTQDSFTNPYGTWNAIDIGNNGIMRVLVGVSDDLGSFCDYLGGASY